MLGLALLALAAVFAIAALNASRHRNAEPDIGNGPGLEGDAAGQSAALAEGGTRPAGAPPDAARHCYPTVRNQS